MSQTIKPSGYTEEELRLCIGDLLHEVADLKRENKALRDALERISEMPWRNSEAPYAVLARHTLRKATR